MIELFQRLERSLFKSQQALLCGDISKIQYFTEEQIGLRDEILENWALIVGEVKPVGALRFAAYQSTAGSELLKQAQAVVQRGRLQSALIRRMQQRLNAIRHLSEGPEASYGYQALSRLHFRVHDVLSRGGV